MKLLKRIVSMILIFVFVLTPWTAIKAEIVIEGEITEDEITEDEIVIDEDYNDNDFFAAEGAFFRITSIRSKKVLETPGGNYNNGAVLQQWSKDTLAENQLWFIEEVSNQYYRIVNKVTKKVMDIKDHATHNGAIVHQWEWKGLDSQLWYLVECENGSYKIKSKLNDKCLDIVGISNSNGAQMQLWDDVEGENQKWNVEQVGIRSITDIISKRTQKVMETPGGNYNNGAILQQWDKDENAVNQVWAFEPIDNTYYKIVNQKTGKVIDIKDAASYNGAVVHQWDYKGLDNQLWYLEICGDGSYKIKSKLNNKCLDIVGISNNNGAQIQVWDDVNGENQKWNINVNTNKDSDGDNIDDFTEIILGTNPLNPDTDRDGLPDGFEYYFAGTDPLMVDTNENGIPDNLEDSDNDGLTNGKEYKLGTLPNNSDTDDDALTDGEEVNVYHTDPLNSDTDGDGLTDWEDIDLGFNPLKKDTDDNGIIDSEEITKQTLECDFTEEEKEGVSKVSVTTDSPGHIRDNVDIYSVYGTDIQSSEVVGLVGMPVEIEAREEFDKAKITFTYDESKLGDVNEENLAVMWYNEEENWYYLMDETSKIDTISNTVSYTTTHFSTYMLVDKEQWYEVWKEEIDYRTIGDDSQYYDIAFVVDTSGSMEDDNAIGKTKTALHTYVEKMYHKDRAGLVRFSWDAELLCGLESTRESLTKKIDSLYASGGTDTNAGLEKGLQLLSTSENTNKKIVILICDGDVNYVQSTINKAIENGIKIYTLNVGYTASSSELKKMSSQTGGEYFFAKDSDDILNSLLEIQSRTIDYVDTTDTDGDGLYDIYEIKGIRIPNGQILYSDPLKVDTDGDEMTDYEEVGEPVLCSLQNERFINNELKKSGVSALSSKSTSIYVMASKKYVSNPKLKDTDGDGIPDKYDPDPKEHFGKIGTKEVFTLTSNIYDIPNNKDVYDNLKASPSNEWDVYNNRFSKKYPEVWQQAMKVLSIKAMARATAAAGVTGSKVGVLKRASKFLKHYNNNSGKTYLYDAKNFITKSKDVKAYYNENVNDLRNACEQATSKGTSVAIRSKNNANLVGAMAIKEYGVHDFDSWLSLGAAEAAMVGRCTYDGKVYKLELRYYIQDCYDFYEPIVADGKEKRIGGCTNDELVILSFYDEAKPFVSIGHYYVKEMTWKKGERLKEL